MKKAATITLFLAAVFTASFAQITNKGNILLGGSTNLNFGFDTEKSKLANGSISTDGKTTSFSIEPTAGYFIMDNLAVGAGIILGTSTFKQDGSTSKSKTSSVQLSPFARYYFDKFYAQGGFQLGSQKSELSTGSTTQTSKDGISGWLLAAGYMVLLNESIALEPQIGYRSIGYKNKDSDNKDITSGLFLRLGVFIYLPKK